MKRYKKKFSILKLILISMVILALIVGFMMLLNKFGHYEYETTTSRYALPTCDKPTKTVVTISYVNRQPRNIKMLWTTDDRRDREYSGYDIEYLDDKKQIIITYDVIGNGTEFALELKPADNYTITLDIMQDISDKYVNAIASFDDSDPNNVKLNIINYGTTSLNCIINMEKTGGGYSKVFNEVIEPGFNGAIELNQYFDQTDNADVVQINIGDMENEEREHIHSNYRKTR